MSARSAIRVLVTLIAWAVALPGIQSQAPSSRAKARPSAPSASSGTTVEIHSIPSRLNVYFCPDKEQAPETDEKGTPVVGTHVVVSDKFLKGTTPLVLRRINPGKYLLAVSPTILITGNKFQVGDPSLDTRAYVSSAFSKFPPQFDPEVKGAVVYSVTVDKEAHQRLTVLAVSLDTPMEEMAALYPPRASFDVDEAKVISELKRGSKEKFGKKQEWSDANLITLVDLLRRGGKAWLHEGDLGVVATIREGGTADFVFMLRLEGSWHGFAKDFKAN